MVLFFICGDHQQIVTLEGLSKTFLKGHDFPQGNRSFEYNPRASRSYERVGFVHEGRVRKYLMREGKR